MKKLAKIIAIVLIAFGAITFFAEGGVEDTIVEHQMNKAANKVANDYIEQYNIAVKNNDAMQAYSLAGMVSQAYLQAKDEEGYKKWKDIADKWGKKIGL